ncbi:HEAT repeat domain-containing protein [Sorangium sp. So ce216]
MTVPEAGSGPGPRAAQLARSAIEEVLFTIQDIPLDLDRHDLRDRLLRAVHCTFAVRDTPVISAAHLDGLREAAAMATEGRALLTRAGEPAAVEPLRRAVERLDAAAAALREGADAVAQIQLARRHELVGDHVAGGPPPARAFRASIGLPELHAPPRRPLLPHVIVEPRVPLPAPPRPPPRTPRPSTFEELEAFANASAAPIDDEPVVDEALPGEPALLYFEPAIAEVDALRHLGRDCLEDIAGLRNLRKPNALESWIDQGPFEQRLLDNLDAFAALGGAVLPLVSLFHAEAKSPDPERAFAVALTLGCIEGSDTVGAAVMTLKQSPPEELPGWLEGFWLAPSPAIDVAMVELCASSRPSLVALALDVLCARGRAPDDLVMSLLDRSEPEIAPRVARALATALPRSEAIDRLERICGMTGDDDLFLAAVESLLHRAHGPAVDILRSSIDARSSPARGRRALALLCLVGRAGDLDRLLAAANAAPTARLLRGLGRFGHVESLGTLLNFLEHEDKDVVAAAAEALERITGAGLRQTVEEPWEIDLPPEASGAGGIPVPARRVERVVTDPAPWSAWVRDKARRLDAKQKTRGGGPFTPLQIVTELEAKTTPLERREEAVLELRLVTGLSSPFSPHDWVARQQRHLTELRAQVSTAASAPGAWSIAARHNVMVPLAKPRSPSPRAPSADAPPNLAEPARRAPSADAPSSLAEPVSFEARASTPPAAPKPAASFGGTATFTLSPELIAHLAAGVLPFQQSNPAADADEGRSSQPPPARSSSLPALPFRPPPGPAGAASAAAPTTRPGSESPTAPTAPGTASSARPAVLSLAQYAALCAELAVFPEQAEAIFERYGLSVPRDRLMVDLTWQERLRRDPAEHQQWQARYRHHVAYWTEQRTRGQR